VSGYVVQKTAYHGMRVTPVDALFDIADLSHLWVLADVYESDLAAVRLGMPAEVTVAYLPGRTWRGRVTNVAPVVEEKTRTVKVRVEVDNADQELKPEMFADVVLDAVSGTGLVIPESAVIHAGERPLVFLDRPDGTLEPRAVQLGPKVQGGVEVLGGLSEGERIVSSANFLLDSESSLKATVAALASAPPSVAKD
jgi:Cu(I)/Ag(I) efflux system membrane fusion protein